MPLKIEAIRLVGTKFDSRTKLTKDQRQAIKYLANAGYSQRKLAAMFHVSRRLVQSILSPPVRKPPQKKYSQEYWREAKRKYRERKKELYQTSQIKFKE